MTPTEIERLAAAVNALRPDWPISSLRTGISRDLAGRPFRDVVVALVWVACDPTTQTPRRVLSDGPWWIAASTPNNRTAGGAASVGELCAVCGRQAVQCRAAAKAAEGLGEGHEFVSLAEERAGTAGGGADRSVERPYVPRHVRRQIVAAIARGKATLAERQARLDERLVAHLDQAQQLAEKPFQGSTSARREADAS